LLPRAVIARYIARIDGHWSAQASPPLHSRSESDIFLNVWLIRRNYG
jgi:hypothetical protein